MRLHALGTAGPPRGEQGRQQKGLTDSAVQTRQRKGGVFVRYSHVLWSDVWQRYYYYFFRNATFHKTIILIVSTSAAVIASTWQQNTACLKFSTDKILITHSTFSAVFLKSCWHDYHHWCRLLWSHEVKAFSYSKHIKGWKNSQGQTSKGNIIFDLIFWPWDALRCIFIYLF